MVEDSNLEAVLFNRSLFSRSFEIDKCRKSSFSEAYHTFLVKIGLQSSFFYTLLCNVRVAFSVNEIELYNMVEKWSLLWNNYGRILEQVKVNRRSPENRINNIGPKFGP